MRRHITLLTLAAVAVAVACSDASQTTSPVAPRASFSGGTGGGGGGGGGGGTVTTPSILPTTAPAPDILMRESFGPADGFRPAGGKGTLKSVGISNSLGGYWLEYPGTKNTAWLGVDAGQSWNFAGCSGDPYELDSPLQVNYGGCVVSFWADPPTSYPTALMPITVALPPEGYEFSMEGYPAPIPNGYVAIGFTNSGALASNLTTSGIVWLRMRDLNPPPGGVLSYELRTGSLATGQVLASGYAGYAGWNHMGLRYTTATQSITLTIGDSVIGTFPAPMTAPKYLAFEGVGVLDNFVLRK